MHYSELVWIYKWVRIYYSQIRHSAACFCSLLICDMVFFFLTVFPAGLMIGEVSLLLTRNTGCRLSHKKESVHVNIHLFNSSETCYRPLRLITLLLSLSSISPSSSVGFPLPPMQNHLLIKVEWVRSIKELVETE